MDDDAPDGAVQGKTKPPGYYRRRRDARKLKKLLRIEADRVKNARTFAIRKAGRRKIDRLVEQQNNLCFYCGAPIFVPSYWKQAGLVVNHTAKYIHLLGGSQLLVATVDHVTPIAKGGTSDIDNLVAACFKCNNRRGRELSKEIQDGKDLV